MGLTRSRTKQRRGGQYCSHGHCWNPVSGGGSRTKRRRGGQFCNKDDGCSFPVYDGGSTRSRSNRRGGKCGPPICLGGGGSPLALEQTDVAAPNWIPVGRGQRELGGGGSTRSRTNRRGGNCTNPAYCLPYFKT